MAALEPLTTRQIIEELRLERNLRALPREVHLAFLHRFYAQVTPGECTLTEQEQALIAAHPDYCAFADRVLAYWRAASLVHHNPQVVEGFLWCTVVWNEILERKPMEPRPPGWPFFTDCLAA